MARRFSSIQVRLVLGFALALALALAGVSWYVGSVADREVARFELRERQAQADRVRRLVARHFVTHRGWADLQPTLEQAASVSGQRIIVTNATGVIVGDSHRDSEKLGVPNEDEVYRLPLARGALRIGSVALAPGEDVPGELRPPAVSRLTRAVDRSLFWAGLASGIGGILLVSMITGRILAPVQTLSAAARHLGQGDFSQRVPASGPGEIGQLGIAFNAMAENLQQAEGQRRNLAADVAHELRTPLSNILGYLEAIKDGLLQPDDQTIDTIYRQVLHLVDLVEDLRVLALAEAGVLTLHRDLVPMEELLRQVLESFKPRADARGVRLSLEIPQNFPLVLLDRTRISQVVGNLLDNAILHTREGSSVAVSADVTNDRMARVTVTDQGEGIPPEVLHQLFERFYRADPSRARTTGGTGLGLTIAKQLVEAHGGSIRAESTPGRGSRFQFELPLPS